MRMLPARMKKPLTALLAATLLVLGLLPLEAAAQGASEHGVQALARDMSDATAPVSSVTLGDNQGLRVDIYRSGALAAYIKGKKQYYRDFAYGDALWVNKKSYNTYYMSIEGYDGDKSKPGALGSGTLIPFAYVNGKPTAAQLSWSKNNLRFTITYSLPPGSDTLIQEWTITNNTAKTITGAKLYAGGDTFFADDDKGYGKWFPLGGGMACVMKDDNSGMMTLSADASTPAARYHVRDLFKGEKVKIREGQDLSNKEYPYKKAAKPVDASYFLQWDYKDIAPGESATIKGKQEWSPAGSVMAVAPNGYTAPPGTHISYSFIFINISDKPAEIDHLQVTGTKYQAKVADLDGVVTVPASSYALVTVELEIPEDAKHGFVDQLTLNGQAAGKNISATTYTTIDEKLPAIKDVHVKQQGNDQIAVAVDYTKSVSPADTTVEIYDLMGKKVKSMTVKGYVTGSDTDFVFTTDGLVLGDDYIAKATVEGIPYPQQKRFTLLKMHTVSFMTDGGGSIPTQLVQPGQYAAYPESVPEKLGCTFSGWYEDAAKTQMFDFANTAVVKDTVLYAKWEEQQVIFDPNGGRTPARTSQSLANGSTYDPPDVNRPGCDFLGWNSAQDGSGRWIKAGDPYQKRTSHILYAQWQAQQS